jgi:hypothetical protein
VASRAGFRDVQPAKAREKNETHEAKNGGRPRNAGRGSYLK